MIRRVALVLWAACAATSVGAAELQVTLRDAVTIPAVHATLADVAELVGEPAVVARAGTVVVQTIHDTASYRVGARQIRAPLRRALRDVSVTIEGECLVRRRVEHFDQAALVAAVSEHVRQRATDADLRLATVRCSGALEALYERDRALRLRPEPITAALWGEVPYRVRLMRGEHEEDRALVVLRVSAVRTIPVAARDLPRGHILELHDIAREEQVLDRATGAVAPAVEDLVGRSLRNAVPQGAPLLTARTRAPVLVRGGSRVVVTVVTPEYEVSVTGTSLSDGARGDRIRVRQPNGALLAAEVTGPGTARVR